MYATREIIMAGRLTACTKLDSLSEDYYPDGKMFNLQLVPTEDSDIEDGSIVRIDAMLPYSNGEYVEVPVRVGEWSEFIFLGIKAGAVDLGKADVYVSEIKDLTI